MPEIEGTLADNVWMRREGLRPLQMKEHKVHPGLFFEMGEDDEGEVGIRRVIYPRDWSQARVQDAVENRSRILESEGCSHCREINIERTTEQVEDTDTRLRLFPGPRPVRDKLLELFGA